MAGPHRVAVDAAGRVGVAGPARVAVTGEVELVLSLGLDRAQAMMGLVLADSHS